MNVILAEEIIDDDISINLIKDTIAISINRSGITYSDIINTKDIQIDGFGIEIYFNFINDILNNNKGEYEIDYNSERCIIQSINYTV